MCKSEERMAGNMTANTKQFLRHIKRRKPASETFGLADNEGRKGRFKLDREIAEQLDEFFAFVFSTKDDGQCL